MASKGTEVLDPLALKAQHAIIYDASTSELKDDTVQLIACLKSGHGPLTRQEAGFLLWYHANDGYDKQSELVASGIVNACMGLLDTGALDVSAPEKTCAAGILVALCSEEEMRELVARGKSGSNTACAVLHGLVQDHRNAMQLYATRVLRMCAEDSSARSVLLRSMENKLVYCDMYKETFMDCSHSHVVGHLSHFLAALLDKRDDLRGEAIDRGLVEAALEALERHKMDSTTTALLKLVLCLLEDKSSWPRLQARGGLQLLVDLLGPPPQMLLDMEMELYRVLLDPDWERQETARLEAARKEEEARVKAAETMEIPRDPITPRAGLLSSTRSGKNMPPRTMSKGALLAAGEDVATTPGAIGTKVDGEATTDNKMEETDHKSLSPHVPAKPPRFQALPKEAVLHLDKSALLTTNKAALKWNSLVSMQTYSLAAGCLYTLCQNTDYLAVISNRVAASRLAPLLNKAMEADGDGGKKKGGKKKGLSLTPEQTQMLVHFSGCLKFLSLMNVNRYRIASYNTVKNLVLLYNECSHTLLRRNAQVILSNMALLAENGQVLLDGGLPEEFLVPRPLRLGPTDVDTLLKEFPGAPIGANSGKVPEPSQIMGAAVKAA